jgi:hypothetical protein
MTEVFLIGYQAQVGKDTLASFIAGGLEKCCVRFSEPIKDIAEDLYNLSDEQCRGSLKDVVDPRYNKTPRQILQAVGASQRAIYEDVWAEYGFRRVESLKWVSRVVIPDFRKRNEYDAAMRWRALDPYCRRVHAIEVTGPRRSEVSGEQDVTETELQDFPFWNVRLRNDSTPEALYEKFLRYYRSYQAA